MNGALRALRQWEGILKRFVNVFNKKYQKKKSFIKDIAGYTLNFLALKQFFFYVLLQFNVYSLHINPCGVKQSENSEMISDL